MAHAIAEIIFQNLEFKKKYIAIFNKRWKEFNVDIYMLAFFLHPKYQGKILKLYLFY